MREKNDMRIHMSPDMVWLCAGRLHMQRDGNTGGGFSIW
jgi:hypothetical protein